MIRVRHPSCCTLVITIGLIQLFSNPLHCPQIGLTQLFSILCTVHRLDSPNSFLSSALSTDWTHPTLFDPLHCPQIGLTQLFSILCTVHRLDSPNSFLSSALSTDWTHPTLFDPLHCPQIGLTQLFSDWTHPTLFYPLHCPQIGLTQLFSILCTVHRLDSSNSFRILCTVHRLDSPNSFLSSALSTDSTHPTLFYPLHCPQIGLIQLFSIICTVHRFDSPNSFWILCIVHRLDSCNSFWILCTVHRLDSANSFRSSAQSTDSTHPTLFNPLHCPQIRLIRLLKLISKLWNFHIGASVCKCQTVQHAVSKFLEELIASWCSFSQRQCPTDTSLLHSRQNWNRQSAFTEVII